MSIETQNFPENDRGLTSYLAEHKGVLSKDGIERAYRALDLADGKLKNRNAVAALQALLAELGHDPGKIDGIWGSNTQRALVNFQREKGVSKELIGKMNEGTYAFLLTEKNGLLDKAEGRSGAEKPTTNEDSQRQSIEEYSVSERQRLSGQRKGVMVAENLPFGSGSVPADSRALDESDAVAEGYGDYTQKVTHEKAVADKTHTERELKKVTAQREAIEAEALDPRSTMDIDVANAYIGKLSGDEKTISEKLADENTIVERTAPKREDKIGETVTHLTRAQIDARFFYDKNGHLKNANGGEFYEDARGNIIEDVSKRPGYIMFGNVAVQKPYDFEGYFRPQEKFWTENDFYMTKESDSNGMLRRVNLDKKMIYDGKYGFSTGGDLIFRRQGKSPMILDRRYVSQGDFYNGNWKTISESDIRKYAGSEIFRSEFLKKAA